ncbi:MAG: prepilin-type N-terminal cleavage/methylation domain-containing protein [Candidatus Latescibacterota bacterium]
MNTMPSRFNDTSGNNGERGMTLVELLIAIAVSSILAFLTFQFLNVNTSSFVQGRAHAEMQQEVRWAMQFVSEHVKLAGNTVPQVLLDDKGLQVLNNFDGAGDAPDSLSIVGSFKSVVLTLDQSMGNEGSQIKCSDKTNIPPIPLVELVAVGDLGFISDGTFSEVFMVTLNQDGHLWHAAALPWNDDSKLDHRYAIGSSMTVVANYSFFVAIDDEGRSNLMVRTQVYPPQVLAGDVEDFQVRFQMKNGQWQNTVSATELTLNELSQVEIYLRTRSPEPIKGYQDPKYGDAYKRMELKTNVIPKNIAIM